jgi:peptidoglycan/xylan/chitin deacetylase (PgdA/CDA1 family)
MAGMKTRVAIIFDDGFAKSSQATAAIFESFGLPAAFAVLAEPKDFAKGCGGFSLWNELQSRGHRVHPHGYAHTDLAVVPHKQAIAEIERCLDVFCEKLYGFHPKSAVYNFAYNKGTPALVKWLKPRVRAVRVGGTGLLNDRDIASKVWHSRTFGPEDPGRDLMAQLDRCRRERPAALCYCLHGLDGENWGAIAATNLRRALEVITTHDAFEYWAVP